MKKLFSLLFTLLIVLSYSGTAFAAQQTTASSQNESVEPVEAYECQSEKVETELMPNGEVQVNQYWTFSCKRHQKMTKFSCEVPKSDKYQISGMKVTQGGNKEYKKLDSFDASRPEKCYAIEETNDAYKIEAYYYIENQSITMVVSYAVKDAMQFHKDTAEFNWDFIKNTSPYDVEIFTGLVILPVGAERKQVKAWTHGQDTYSLTVESGELISLSIDELPAHKTVDIHVTAPLSLFPKAQKTDDKDVYLQILKEENDPEQNPAYTARKNKKDRIVQTAVPVFLLVAAGLIIFYNSRRRKKEQN